MVELRRSARLAAKRANNHNQRDEEPETGCVTPCIVLSCILMIIAYMV